MNLLDKDTIAKLAGLQVEAEKIEKDACAQFMDMARENHRREHPNEPMYTGD